ncbi:hypothetical protein GCM10017557_74490 [Streptomyces aurantiacus]|uniref:Tetracyclin repressor-like C-terminal domain-containing protein n=1 Tax=Streptomyces aurantiacus TaxID=47760 RepID=A0A7G1PFU6_9ACTN|nr:hypothetical protein GCM10017557_74490 [Streptomyces aurantiacus]
MAAIPGCAAVVMTGEGAPERIGIVLFATLQGIASIINGNIVRPELLDGLVETAVEQFLRGAGPLP